MKLTQYRFDSYDLPELIETVAGVTALATVRGEPVLAQVLIDLTGDTDFDPGVMLAALEHGAVSEFIITSREQNDLRASKFGLEATYYTHEIEEEEE